MKDTRRGRAVASRAGNVSDESPVFGRETSVNGGWRREGGTFCRPFNEGW